MRARRAAQIECEAGQIIKQCRARSLSLFRSRSLQVLLTESSHSFGGVGCFLLWARGQVPRTKKQVLAQTKGPYFSCDVLLLHTLALAARLVFKNSALPEISRVLILPLGLTHTHTHERNSQLKRGGPVWCLMCLGVHLPRGRFPFAFLMPQTLCNPSSL